jgi:hypothetical protein
MLALKYCHNSKGGEILPYSPNSPDLHHQTSTNCSQGWKSTTEVSTSTPIKKFKIKSSNGYVPRTHFFSEGLDKLLYGYDAFLSRLGDYMEK